MEQRRFPFPARGNQPTISSVPLDRLPHQRHIDEPTIFTQVALNQSPPEGCGELFIDGGDGHEDRSIDFSL